MAATRAARFTLSTNCASSLTTWSDGITARIAFGVLADGGQRGNGNGCRRIARDRLQDDGVRLHAEPVEFFLHQEAMIVVAKQDGRRKAGISASTG